ncbi:hypothetical protein MMC28_011771 [Mycoblastus sanguinarius]|nr:hypothetical protein [Mycoblastus sanguinarius]
MQKLDQRRQAIEMKEKTITTGDRIEINRWLDNTRWNRYLVGFEYDKLVEFVEPPDVETEPMLEVIGGFVDEMIQHCQRNISTGKAGKTMRMTVMRIEKHQDRSHPLQAYMDERAIRQYGRPWKQIAMFFGRIYHQREPPHPKYKFNRQ